MYLSKEKREELKKYKPYNDSYIPLLKNIAVSYEGGHNAQIYVYGHKTGLRLNNDDVKAEEGWNKTQVINVLVHGGTPLLRAHNEFSNLGEEQLQKLTKALGYSEYSYRFTKANNFHSMFFKVSYK